MTIALDDNTPRISYTVAEGVTRTTPFPVPFVFFDGSTDLNVYVDNVERTYDASTSNTTLYTVTGGNGSTGSVTTTVTGATGGSTVIITRDVPLARTTDFPSSGAFEVAKLNTELDTLLTMITDADDENTRALRLQDSDEAVSLTLPLKADRLGKVLGFNATTGAAEAGPTIADVSTLSAITADISTLADIEDGTDATDAIQTVAGISGNVTTVAGISGQVSTVAGIETDITNVAADATDIGTVASNINDINTVATNINDVVTVANDLNEAISEIETAANDLNEVTSEIDTVANSIGNVDTVGTNINDVTTVAGQISPTNNIATVAGDSAAISTVAGDSTAINTVAGDSTAINAVYNDATDIGNVSTNITEVTTVAGQISPTNNIATVASADANISAVAGQISPTNNIATVAGDSANISTVAGLSADIQALADIEDGTTATNAISNVGDNITNVNTVATNITGVNSFADRYRVASTAPTTSLDIGDLYYDTTSDTMKVYGSSGWQNAGSSVNGTSQRYHYDITGTPTSVTGADKFGNTLAYDAGYVDVYVNGVRMSDEDITITSGDTVTFASALANGDDVDIVAYGTFSVSSLNADNLDSGTVPSARVSGAYTGITSVGTLTSLGVAGASGAEITITDNSPSTVSLFMGAGNSSVSIGSTTSDPVTFLTNNTEKARIDSNGNVGIGTSSPASDYRASIKGDYSAIIGGIEFDSGGGDKFTIGHASATSPSGKLNVEGAGNLIINTNNTERMRIDSSGNVGIGNDSPSSFYSLADNLVVGTGSGGHGLTIYSGSADSGYIGFNDTASASMQGFIQYNHSGDYMAFAPNGSEKMRIDANGHVTMPSQSAFLAQGQAMTNIAHGTTLVFGTEIFDQNADYNSSTYTFTAPVDGKYALNLFGYLLSLDTSADYYQVTIRTSKRDYNWLIDPNWASDVAYWAMNVNVLANMDASDTAYVLFTTNGGTQQVDLDAGSFFSGYLVA